MGSDERDADDARQEPRKKSSVMSEEHNSGGSTKRTKDKALVQNLRELYRPVLDEPVPQEFLEILRRKKAQGGK